jgi:hypothetical protein
VQNFTQLGEHADFCLLLFGVVYVAWCSFAMGLTKEQPVCIRFYADLGERCGGLSLVTRAGFAVMIVRQSNNLPSGKVQTCQDQKRRDR